MSSVVLHGDVTAQLQARVLNLYAAVIILMIGMIGLLTVYSIRLGPLVGPGVESSFGYAVALMFLASALIVHVIDRMYRVWPAGRSVSTVFPGFFTDRGLANALRILIFVAAGAAVAYVLALTLTS
ncbi:MAG: hypothetical protein L3K14_06585 [Thermoplasmata archaeon]|nr:hypothetical protein [Thermoplasmata archaeon]